MKMSEMVVEMFRDDIEEAKYKVNMAFDRLMDNSNCGYGEDMTMSEMEKCVHRMEIGIKVYKDALNEFQHSVKQLSDYEIEKAKKELLAMAKGGKEL